MRRGVEEQSCPEPSMQDIAGRDRGDPALVVFVDESGLKCLRCLRRGFRHCFIAVRSARGWVICDPLSHQTGLSIVDGFSPRELAAWYRDYGLLVVETHIRPAPLRPAPIRPFTCVEMVKRVLMLPGFSPHGSCIGYSPARVGLANAGRSPDVRSRWEVLDSIPINAAAHRPAAALVCGVAALQEPGRHAGTLGWRLSAIALQVLHLARQTADVLGHSRSAPGRRSRRRVRHPGGAAAPSACRRPAGRSSPAWPAAAPQSTRWPVRMKR